jgi:hypothetical protein
MHTVFPPNYTGKEGTIPCGRKEQSLKAVRRVGEGDKVGWPMAFQHDSDITHVKVPSLTTVRKIFHVKVFVG